MTTQAEATSLGPVFDGVLPPPTIYHADLHPCSYLPERLAASAYFGALHLSGGKYEELLSQGWRRSGRIFYQTECPKCRLCLPLRIDAGKFQTRDSHRRCQRRNRDLAVSITTELDYPAAIELYAKYQKEWHQAPSDSDPDDIKSFLADSAVESLLTLYHHGEKLVGAGWIDILDDGLSSVYFAFDSREAKRSLGVFSLLTEIELTKRLGKRWLYLGFMVPGCPTMAYKRLYQPHQLLIDGQWRDDPGQAWIDQFATDNPGQPSTS